METTSGPKKTGISYIGAFFGMLITFLAGIFVGAHPAWVPNKWFGGDGSGGGGGGVKTVNVPPVGPGPTTMETLRAATTKP